MFNVPTALVSLVDNDRQWFKARVGLDATQTSRDEAFCSHAILGKTVMVVPDAMQDGRVMDNPLVIGTPGVRFYTGAPLIAEGGQRIGTLCVMDYKPRRPPTDNETQALADLAEIVVAELDRRRQRRAVDAGAVEEPATTKRETSSKT